MPTSNKTVVIIGANGQLGSDLLRTVSSDVRLVPLTHADLELKDAVAVRQKLAEIKPDIVINTAAFLNVDLCEERWQDAFAVNAYAVRDLAQICQELNACLIQISTDYVFDGKKKAPYTKEDLPNPLNVYGLSKLMGEYFVRMYAERHLIIRSAGLYGKAKSSVKGTNIVEIFRQKGREGKISLVVDQVVNPTYTKDLAEGIWSLIQKEACGTYHVTNKGQCTWQDFAKRIFEQEKLDVTIKSVSFADYKRKAKRPQNSVLVSDVPLRLWKDALAAYLWGRKS